MQYRLVRRVPGRAAMALFLVLSGACGGDDDGDDPEPPAQACLDDSLDYARFGASFIDAYCTSCHGAAVKGYARQGAPIAYVFDTHAQVIAAAAAIKEQVVVMQTMPFGSDSPKPSDEARAKLGHWLDCGAP